MMSPSHDALERGVPLTPILTLLAEKGGTSPGLIPNGDISAMCNFNLHF